MSDIKSRKDEEITGRIRFKPVKTEPDVVYEKLWQRVMNSVALLVVSSFLYKMYLEPRPLAYLEVTSMTGSKTQVLLPDSTVVWLNGNSHIRYPEVFDSETRQIAKYGE